MMPESLGGLFTVAASLFHKHPKVRRATVLLLKRLDTIPEGAEALSSLNYFLLLTYTRYVRQPKGKGTVLSRERIFLSVCCEEFVENFDSSGRRHTLFYFFLCLLPQGKTRRKTTTTTRGS
jgi:hypothetical protein